MKLYLLSYKIGDEKHQKSLKEMLGSGKHAVYISSGLDFAKPDVKKKHQDWDVRELKELDLEVSSIDLRNYFDQPGDLNEVIKSTDLIYVSGGNVYDLRRAMKMSGLDEIVKSLVETDIIYAGYSAGVCVLSPTLKGYHLVDEPDLKTYGDPETIWEGLGIIDWQFAPHFESDHSESDDIAKEIAYHKKHNLPYRALKDGDVIIEEV